MTDSKMQKEDGPRRVLDPGGRLVGTVHPDLEEKDLLLMYRWMLLARRYDERCLKLQRQGRLLTFAPGSGQEAAQVGSASALRPQDWIFPSYREHAASMIHGMPMEYLIALWQGNEEGSRHPEGVNIFTYNVPIATQLPHAVGFAHAAKLRGDDLVSVVYFGDGATSEGDFHEACNFAGVFSTPTIFFCSNNGWAISYPRARQTRAETIAQKALAYGFEGVQVDGMDVLAVYEVTRRAVERAAAGDGPTLIEAVTYRFGPHTTADDPTRYRDEDELAAWKEKDPLLRMRAFLVGEGLWDDAKEEELEEEIRAEVARGVDATEELHARHERDPEEIFVYLYEEMTPRLEEQLRFLRDEIAEGGR
jgi:pyruvate dehydrogenase E1 component alpha subunit